AVFAPHRLEHGATRPDRVELAVEGGGKPVEADREQVESALWNSSTAKRIDHLASAPVGDVHRHDCTSNCSVRSATSRVAAPVAGSAAKTAYPSMLSSC